MIKDTFKLEEVCAIIKTCRELGVKNFEFNGLKLELDPAPAPTTEQFLSPLEKQEAAAQTKEAIAEEQELIKQRELDQMLIDDPEGYFDAVKRGVIADEEKA